MATDGLSIVLVYLPQPIDGEIKRATWRNLLHNEWKKVLAL